ncbi:glycosyltransferase family 2 protein [Enterococcus sp. HY326]|uniref:glycosyltransferase family 2 protein n=1 Tax=Enterococcus sp. HY326 TaxID=2971265 RepID=UPI00223EE078|nr:glycosyltransferase family 2 protein [Enterococcus sp. HY326]
MNKITAVVVLYQEKISDLPSLAVLEKLTSQKNFQLIFYDNSPQPQENPFAADQVLYHHDQRNLGIATAYNYAWHQAQQFGANALLLLDDDTALTEDFFDTIASVVIEPTTGAIVPQIVAGGQQISPVFADVYINRASQFPTPGSCQRHVMAINSGSLIPLALLENIGGFNEDFPLDFLDHWLFWKIFQQGYTVEILDSQLQHQLSVLNYSQVSNQRYQSILTAEANYYQHYQQELLPNHKKQLLKRLVKQFIKVKNRKIWRQTLAAFKNLTGGST